VIMRSPTKAILIIFLISCFIAGVGTVSLTMVNEPMEFLSSEGGFDFQHALAWFVFSALYLGIPLFAALLVGVGFFAALGFQPLKYLRRRGQLPGNDVIPPPSSS
jgi:hypothetical protein